MQAFTTLPNTFLSSLQRSLASWLPKVFISIPSDFTQPLLNKEEILDLRLRISTQTTQPENRYDTASKRIGDTRSIHRGYGLDYEESRPYQPGDEPRYMNWQLTARTGELFMKVFREEHHPGVFILVDRRQSMRFGTRKRLKVTQAARAATCISFAVQQSQSSVGGVIMDAVSQAPHWIKETSGEQASLDLIHAACAPCPPTLASQEDSSTPAKNEFDFSYMLNMLQAVLVPGTTLYMISDFIDLGEQHRSKLMQLAAENQIYAIHISDPAEQQLPHVGKVRFQTPGTNQDMAIDTNASNICNDYEQAAQKHFISRKQLFHALDINYTQLSTISDSIETELSVV